MIVVKEFKTHNRRFKVGAEVSEADIEGSNLSWAHLKTKGFIESPKKPAKAD